MPRPAAPTPSLWLPLLVSLAGCAASGVALVGVVQSPSETWSMVPLVLAASLAIGGFSAARMVQWWMRARAVAAAVPPSRADLPHDVEEAHVFQAIWVIGVGASIAFMGLLGLWSSLDGRPSGLEPGWPLLLAGAVVAGCARWAWLRTSELWARTEA